MAKLKYCTGKTVKGKRCRARPLKGTKRCAAHPLSTGLDPVFGSPEQAKAAGKLGGRPRLPPPHERMRELLEERAEELVDTYFDAARELVVFAKYEGEVLPSDHPDYAGRVAVIERLLDRVHGKPGPAVELKSSETEHPLAQIVAGDDPAIADAAREFLAKLIPDA